MTPEHTSHCPGPLGASRSADQEWTFVVWAPNAGEVAVRIEAPGQPRDVVLTAADRGYHRGVVGALDPEPTYRFLLDGRPFADPASRHQPTGVHGPSQGFDPSGFDWQDAGFVAPAPDQLVIYELHIGTFTEQGTFDAAIDHLDELADLGINAVEPMPINAFSGTRNWGYDGVFPFAAQESYGGPAAFQRFVDACHRRGLAVILDVVYNHLGPEGAVHQHYAPYFTETYATPWGPAMNFSESGSDEVRRYFCDNALMWLRDFHVDGLRFDAIHGIVDPTASPFLREVTQAISVLGEQLGRRFVTIAESADNNSMVVTDPAAGGLGFDLQWSDDFHHALHALLTGERESYYQDFGSIDQLATAYTHGFVYRGEYSHFRGRRHGCYAPSVRTERLVGFAQNHDQIGNRAGAERLVSLIGLERARLAIAATLLAPSPPLLFMGEEYAETAPFPYFVDHGDPKLLAAVRSGRAAEFGNDGDQLDPGSEETYVQARLDRSRRESPEGKATLALVRRLLALRRDLPLIREPVDESFAQVDRGAVVLTRRRGPASVALAFNLGEEPLDVRLPDDRPWRQVLDSDDPNPSDGTPTALVDSVVALKAFGFALCVADAEAAA